MSYIVKVRDGLTYRLNDEDGNSLRSAWESAKHPFPAQLGSGSILSTQIVSIIREQLTEADLAPEIDLAKWLDAGTRCRGQYSMQGEINKIAFAESRNVSDVNPTGLKWPKYISDRGWREMVRQKLRATQPDGWCDHRANECACEGDYRPNEIRHHYEHLEGQKLNERSKIA